MSPATTALPVISLRERVGILALVLLLHVGFVLVWMIQPAAPKRVLNELSVSIYMQPVSVAKPQAAPHRLKPRTVRTDQPVSMSVVREVAEAAPPVASPPALSAQVAPTTVAAATADDAEPDYSAGYLNNPRPAYPMVARRMGWQGRVILSVEVLADGACGVVSVLHSSGHEVLDNAAMNTVKSWRFVPARRAGRVVTQWFKVPIVFSLEDNEA